MIKIQRTILSLALLALFAMAIQACTNQPKAEEAPIEEISEKPSLNPNGDSELALLMRSMEDEVKRIKKQVEKGEAVEIELDHGKILSAHATEPEKAASPEFKGFAKSYLAQIEALKNAKGENATMQYKSLVATCLSCHKSLCPGPVVRIKKLQMKEN